MNLLKEEVFLKIILKKYIVEKNGWFIKNISEL
jgi:hypothetical protein